MTQTLFVVALALAASALLYRFTQPPRVRAARPAALRGELRRLVHDPAVAERLIDRARRRHPDADEATVLRAAIREVRADRRR